VGRWGTAGGDPVLYLGKPYAACQNVAAAAQELEFHGLVAPAATKLGETLVLFTDLLPPAEHPVRTADELWVKLPPDPRSS